jgi:hypothetical protein
MSPDLRVFLQRLYNTSVTTGQIPDVRTIYGNYNTSLFVSGEIADSQQLEEAKRILKGLFEIKATCYLQKSANEAPKEFDVEYHHFIYVEQVYYPAEYLEEPLALLDCTYWFQREGAIKALKRVYVHLADPISTHGIVVLKALVPKLNVLDGFQKVKMFGPIQGRNRNDSIVAYCTTPAAQNAVANAVVNLGPNCVLPDIPNFVHKVGPGVGIADEPPQVAVIREEKKKSQSFGKFLSKLIYSAWETYKQKNKTSEREFLELVEVALQTARINPDAPHEHPERTALENMGPEFANTLKSALSRFADQRPIRPFRSAG